MLFFCDEKKLIVYFLRAPVISAYCSHSLFIMLPRIQNVILKKIISFFIKDHFVDLFQSSPYPDLPPSSAPRLCRIFSDSRGTELQAAFQASGNLSLFHDVFSFSNPFRRMFSLKHFYFFSFAKTKERNEEMPLSFCFSQ